MKNFVLLLLYSTLLSCTKTDTLIQDERCTNYMVNNPAIQLLTAQQMDTIHYLYDKNGLNSATLQPFAYYTYNDKTKLCFQYQYVNNLKVFVYYLGFRFNQNDSLTSVSGYRINGNIQVPNTPRYNQSYIRAVFVHEFENQKDWYMTSYTDSTKKVIEAGCLDMELGYLDLDIGNRSLNFTRAWFVKPSGRQYPQMYIDDMTGKRIDF